MSDQLNCLNCGKELEVERQFCPQCGQKHKKNWLSVGNLIGDFIENVFNWDSKIFNSLSKIWRPAYLLKEYSRGKRAKYLPPMRFFIGILLLHLTIVAFFIKDLNFQQLSFRISDEVNKSKLLKKFDESSIYKLDSCSIADLDTIRQDLFKNTVYPELDTFTNFPEFGTFVMDSLVVTKQEMIDSTAQQIIDAKNISDYRQKLTFKQLHRFVQNPNAIFSSVLGNVLWVGVLIVFLSALILKLLYIRRKVFYLEHVYLMVYFQIFAWLVVSISLLISIALDKIPFNEYTIGAVAISVLYLFASMKIYYKQGFFKTFIKFALLCTFYIFFASILAGLILLVSFYLL